MRRIEWAYNLNENLLKVRSEYILGDNNGLVSISYDQNSGEETERAYIIEAKPSIPNSIKQLITQSKSSWNHCIILKGKTVPYAYYSTFSDADYTTWATTHSLPTLDEGLESISPFISIKWNKTANWTIYERQYAIMAIPNPQFSPAEEAFASLGNYFESIGKTNLYDNLMSKVEEKTPDFVMVSIKSDQTYWAYITEQLIE
jgi:hypothetical protein